MTSSEVLTFRSAASCIHSANAGVARRSVHNSPQKSKRFATSRRIHRSYRSDSYTNESSDQPTQKSSDFRDSAQRSVRAAGAPRGQTRYTTARGNLCPKGAISALGSAQMVQASVKGRSGNEALLATLPPAIARALAMSRVTPPVRRPVVPPACPKGRSTTVNEQARGHERECLRSRHP
jgi:hypothetical protein